jgi:hypothetical protein
MSQSNPFSDMTPEQIAQCDKILLAGGLYEYQQQEKIRSLEAQLEAARRVSVPIKELIDELESAVSDCEMGGEAEQEKVKVARVNLDSAISSLETELESTRRVVAQAEEIGEGPHTEICRGRCGMCRALAEYRKVFPKETL